MTLPAQNPTRFSKIVRSRFGTATIVLLTASLFLAGCGSAAEQQLPTPRAATAAFPRTVAVPAGNTTAAARIILDTEPQRVAALTYETAELVAALGAADRLVMVPNAVTNPILTNHHQDMLAVETKAPTESTTNAEAVIQTAPDLVLLSARHGLEDGAGKVLAAAGIPVLVLPNTWATVEDMLANIALTGEALGLDTEADTLAATIKSGLSAEPVDSNAAAETEGSAPSVLVLSNQAGRPFVTAGAAFPLELLRLAGAHDAGDALGLSASGPITAEQVIRAAPDAILLIDMVGSGEDLFAPIMKNPAVAALPAVANGQVLLVEGRHVQALGLDGVLEGLDAITAWLGTGSSAR